MLLPKRSLNRLMWKQVRLQDLNNGHRAAVEKYRV